MCQLRNGLITARTRARFVGGGKIHSLIWVKARTDRDLLALRMRNWLVHYLGIALIEKRRPQFVQLVNG
jgi:hypothetical protein